MEGWWRDQTNKTKLHKYEATLITMQRDIKINKSNLRQSSRTKEKGVTVQLIRQAELTKIYLWESVIKLQYPVEVEDCDTRR